MSLNDPVVIIGLGIGVLLALVGLFRPFLGLLVLVMIHFVQPGELVPSLDKFRIELTYGAALLVAFVVYRASRPGPALVSNPVVFATLLLVGAAFLSVPLAVWKSGAFWSAVGLIKNVVLLVLIIGLVNTNGRMRKLLWVMVGLLGWFAASGFISYLHGEFLVAQGIERAEGVNSIAGGPNQLAAVILALLPFLIALLRCTRSILVRLALLGCGGLALGTMAVTGSRICMIALIVIAAYYGLRSRHKVPALLLGGILLLTLWLAMPEQYKQRYLTVEHFAAGGELDGSNEFRLHIWEAGWRMFLDHPVLGVGAGQFSTGYGMAYSGRAHGPWMNPHNLLIQVGCELGVVGLLAFGYFFTQIVRQIWPLPRAEGDPALELNYQVAVACGVMLLAIVIMSGVGHTLYRPFWYLLGGFAAANRLLADALVAGEAAGTAPVDQAKESEDYQRRDAPVPLMEEGRR